MPTPPSALSCTTCRARKIRCDKVHPCSACRRSGVECVFPTQRQQRRKQGRRNEELLRRLDHLEGLVDRLGGEVAVTARAHAAKGGSPPPPEASASPADASDWMAPVLLPHVLPPRTADQGGPKEDGTYPVMKEDGGRYLGEDFWTSLSGEVEGLRELLNAPESEDEADTGQTSVSSPPLYDPYEKRLLNSLFVFSGDIEATDLRWLHPPGPQIEALANVYWDRVDAIFKTLHRPTVQPLLAAAARDAATIPKNGGEEALMFSIYFTAVTSLTPEECLKLLGKDRSSLAGQFRHCCEISLANADFLNSTDLQVLQAFTLYLLCLRCHNRTRSVWTLISLAVRIAQDLNLHRDGSVTGFSPFDTEMRRRLWWQITVLDIRACEDRGSFPLIDHSLCSTKMPLNINDEDISPETRTAPTERVGCTEMSFSRLCQEASMIAPRFFSPVPANIDDDQKREHWQTQIQNEVEAFKARLDHKFVRHCDPSNPIEHVISQVVKIVCSEFWLLVHYPIQTRRYAFKSRATKAEILDVAITHLITDHELELKPISAKYKWYYDTYVQWHPLAVALAELCVQTRGPGVDRAWKGVDAVYERARSRVTDVSLWRPVKKLHQKAKKARAEALRTATAKQDDTSMSDNSSETPAAGSGPQLPLDSLNRFFASQPAPFPPASIAPSSQTPGISSTTISTPQQPLGVSLGQQQVPQVIPATTAQGLEIMSPDTVAHMSNISLDAYGDPVNWQDWDDFVQSTWIAEAPDQQQQKTNTPQWMLDMGMTNTEGGAYQ